MVTAGMGGGVEEGSQKVPPSSYKINQPQGCQYHKVTVVNTAMWYAGKWREWILRVLITKRKLLPFHSISAGWWMFTNPAVVIISQ